MDFQRLTSSNLYPTPESLKRFADMDNAEVRKCQICNQDVKNGDRAVRYEKKDPVSDAASEWIHYWHVE